ncbi:hypothetical protein AB3662_44885 [Sorangium cellulosum]|uniref:hypothetical protein n=1 Tax=Sorangium cellulosum TaxID=56 RepID=UPI003D9A50A4
MSTAVHAEAGDDERIERLVRHCARPPFARERIEEACSPFRCHRQPEQATDRLVNDPSPHLIPEGDGAAQDAGERGHHRSPRRRPGHGELPRPEA